jgi:hypothetical protein
MYYLELFHASLGKLNRWSRLHLQLLVPTLVSRTVDVGRRPVVKIIAESYNMIKKHVVPTSLSGIMVGKKKELKNKNQIAVWKKN